MNKRAHDFRKVINKVDHTADIMTASNIEVLAVTPARFALCSPRRLPILRSCQILGLLFDIKIPYLTDTATPNAKGAWKVVEADTRRTDWAARVTGPNLIFLSPLIAIGVISLTDLPPLINIGSC